MNRAPVPHGFRQRPSRTRPARGLTVIELLISISIGLFIVASITYMYAGSRNSYRVNSSVAHIQEGGRFGLDALLRDARRLGYVGCGSRESINTQASEVVDNLSGLTLPGTGGVPIAFIGPATALFGISASGYQFSPAATTTYVPPPVPAGRPAPPGWVAGDVVQMVVPTSASEPLLADPVGTSVTIADNSINLRAGDNVLISNCASSFVATVAADPVANGANVSVTLGPVGTVPADLSRYGFITHPSIQRIDAVTYYVGQVPGRWPALYRYSATYGVSEEIIDHVENMNILYGVGNGVPAPASAATPWSNVTSVRVSLQVVGDEFNVGRGQVVTLVPFTAGFPAPDTRLRQVFTGTAALRERL